MFLSEMCKFVLIVVGKLVLTGCNVSRMIIIASGVLKAQIYERATSVTSRTVKLILNDQVMTRLNVRNVRNSDSWRLRVARVSHRQRRHSHL